MSAAVMLWLSVASSYVVLPVHAANPPPQDPTLLRLSKTIAEAIHEVVGEDIRVASREQRDERCPQEDGACPKELAALLDVDRAIVLVLDKDFKELTVRVFHGKLGVEREGKIPCTWESGAVDCDTSKLAPIFADQGGPNALASGEVEKAFKAISPKLESCTKAEPKPAEAWISFRVRSDGSVYDVRIDPKELGEQKGFACVATTVESLKIRKFSGSTQMFRFSLVEQEPAKPAKKKQKARHK